MKAEQIAKALVIGGAVAGVLYWLAHSWNVTGVIEAGAPTLTYNVGSGGGSTSGGPTQGMVVTGGGGASLADVFASIPGMPAL